MVEDEKVVGRKTVRELGKRYMSRGKQNKVVSWKGDGEYGAEAGGRAWREIEQREGERERNTGPKRLKGWRLGFYLFII